jgi:hypothetical protein
MASVVSCLGMIGDSVSIAEEAVSLDDYIQWTE